jgi:hypothetical protein
MLEILIPDLVANPVECVWGSSQDSVSGHGGSHVLHVRSFGYSRCQMMIFGVGQCSHGLADVEIVEQRSGVVHHASRRPRVLTAADPRCQEELEDAERRLEWGEHSV